MQKEEIEELRKDILTRVINRLTELRWDEISNLKHFENPLCSLAAYKESAAEDKMLRYKIKFNDEELSISFRAGTFLLEPDEGFDFYLYDDYAVWTGAVNEQGVLTDFDFQNEKENSHNVDDFGEIEELDFGRL